jgi:hypothetical protein
MCNGTHVIPSPSASPTDRCDNEAEKEEDEKEMERPPNKYEIKKALKTLKMVRPQVWTVSHLNC